MSSTFNFNKEWELSLEKQLSRLGKKRRQVCSLTYDDFNIRVNKASEAYSKSSALTSIHKLQRVLDQLNTFTKAITSIVQSSPELTGFIWGSIQAVITVASRFTNLLALITDMLYELASMVVQLNRYLDIFPESEEMQQCTRFLIDDFVGFSISALSFFNKWPIYNLLRLFWSNIDKKFEATKSNISKHYTQFQRVRQLEVDLTLIDSSKKITEILPTVKILPSDPSKLFEVPLIRNPHFSEREDELLRVRDSLNVSGSNGVKEQRACLLQGLGGIGKTAIALEYAYRYRDEYNYVFWIPAETNLDITNAIGKISLKLGLTSPETINKEPQHEVERFRYWLEGLTTSWLLILDNVEDHRVVSPVWSQAGLGHVLLTSQKSELAQACCSTVLVRPLDEVSGPRFFLKQMAIAQSYMLSPSNQGSNVLHSADDENQKLAQMISAELSGIPLAIIFIAGNFSTMPLDAILDDLKQYGLFTAAVAPDSSTVLVHYGKPFGKTWDIAENQLAPSSILLLHVLAMLGSTGVSEAIIFAGQQDPDLSIFGATSRGQYAIPANSELRGQWSRHLVERQSSDGGAYLLMHRVVQKNILERLKARPDAFGKAFDAAFKLLLRVFPKQSPVQAPQNDLWQTRSLITPHILSLCTVFESYQACLTAIGIDFAEMVTAASGYFWEAGLYGDGSHTSDIAVAICDKLGNHLSSKKANTYAISSAVRLVHGISSRRKAQDLAKKALHMRQHHLHTQGSESVTDEDVTCWGNAWNDVGWTLLDAGSYQESLEPLYLAWDQRKSSVLCQREYNHIPNSPMNVAVALAGMGRYDEAIALATATVEKVDKAFDQKCALSQEVHFYLACILVSAGRYEEAFEEARNVHSRRVETFGKSSRPTSDAAYILATIEHKRGNMEPAASILKMTISQPNGWTRETKARAKYRLGIILTDLQREKEAAPLIKSAQDSLASLWALYAEPWMELTEVDEEIAFDLLAAMSSGRSTLGKGSVRSDPRLGILLSLCTLDQDKDWLAWVESIS
ncbi:unnamed protein product [Clonostachys byssicola]|uniref:NB-ARC domain-containing protein n=1 Tax=Clonostachys byssicola TaxID=160290 RepID=A0A9N9UBD8_9HYPO|nr:unnamed protein product [Clonostachys byssicola]